MRRVNGGETDASEGGCHLRHKREEVTGANREEAIRGVETGATARGSVLRFGA
jgi:hypothetical protein